MSERRIGVYICQCGGNISDYVDVEKVREAVGGEPGLVVAKTAMFTCSDATQQEMAQDIEEQKLDGLVVASCSPKLHTFTFRGVAKRAGLNPYQYTQVNVREQCSWTHTDDKAGATKKAIRLVRAGIAHTRLSEPLEPTVVETVPKALVIGGGVAGLRAAVGLSDIGLGVVLIEKQHQVGGWVAGFEGMYPNARNGRQLIAHLWEKVQERSNITVFTDAEVVGKSGSFGNYRATVRVNRQPAETITVDVGSIIVATGFDSYQPEAGEYGYGMDGVLTLPEFKKLVDGSDGPLTYKGKPVKDIAYIYCVGSRQKADVPNAHQYCSRYCCNAAVHASLSVAARGASGENGSKDAKGPKVHQYHLYRDMRTYGKYELLYKESREEGSVFLKYGDDAPPAVARDDKTGRLMVTVADRLTKGTELTIPVDLAVLVTGMVPRSNEELVKTLKLPVGKDGFFNEIHPKLRPVETVVDGVYICGSCQGPKNSAESVASALAAVTQSAGILKKGFAELEPLVATVAPDQCTWCGKCQEACPYGAVEKVRSDAGHDVAVVREAVCKGCGGCVPACPKDAINLQGYTDAQVRAMIDGLLKEIG
ncbi:MAG: CoB--CoM heterodisulfide reductase iron-sulfur subunit A family protein [Bacillota bacterium]